MRADGREHTRKPGHFDKAGSSLPPSSTTGGVPETFEGARVSSIFLGSVTPGICSLAGSDSVIARKRTNNF